MRIAIETLQYFSVAAFLIVASFAFRTWFASRERADLMAAIATACLGFYGLLARIAGIVHNAALTDVSIVMFLGSGLGLMEVRATIVSLRRTARLVLYSAATTFATWLILIGVPATPETPYSPQQRFAVFGFLLVWTWCVVEPVIVFLRATKSRPAVMRARLRMLSTGYMGIVMIILIGVALRSDTSLALALTLHVFAMVLVPFFFIGLSPPASIKRRWMAREAQRESARMLLTLPAIVWSTDADLRITSSNGSGLQVLGQRADGYVGSTIEELYERAGISETEFGRTSIQMHRRALAGESVTFEGEREGRAREYWLEPLLGPDGRVAGVLGLAIDISERKRTENALAEALVREHEAAEHLRALDQMKTAFMTAVSHELRTPLAGIVGWAATLRREAELTPSERTMAITRLIAGSRKLEALLTDLLDMDRISRGIIEPVRRRTDVAGLVQRVVVEWCEDSERAVDLDLAPVWCAIDAAKVERIVENLLSNAARYAPAGSPIWVRVEQMGAGALITVDDAGPGVPEDMRDTIFEAFRQAEPRSAHSPGVGIGLSLVARFSEMHGGRAWVEPREGGGASFRVFLPENAKTRALDPVAGVVERAG